MARCAPPCTARKFMEHSCNGSSFGITLLEQKLVPRASGVRMCMLGYRIWEEQEEARRLTRTCCWGRFAAAFAVRSIDARAVDEGIQCC